ncbi:MAG: zinc ribbon domain-containing protein [Armatimonadia bacterium]
MGAKVACPKCGEENYPTDRQCLSCGTALQAAAKPAPAAAPATTPVAAKAPEKPAAAPNAQMEWYLWAPAVLPMGIMIFTRGGAIWGAMGGALVGLNMWVGKKSDINLGLRIGIMLASSALAYGIVIPLVMAARKLG